MIRNWWRSIGFFWQVYLIMVLTFGGVITLVEGVAEPFALDTMENWLGADEEMTEVVLWIVGVLLPTLALGFIVTKMIMRKLDNTVHMAKRLSCGDLGARIAASPGRDDAFTRLATAFNDMADSLERLLAHEKRLLADISHELRSPLTRMGVATALLPMKRRPGEFDAAISALDAEIAQMNDLVALLLKQGRDRLDNRESFSAVNLSELAAESVDAFAPVAAENGKRLTPDIAPGMTVWGHALRVRSILDNILSNALFYGPADRDIDLRLFRHHDFALLSVRDRGSGVPEAHLRDIFRPFFRVDESRARTSGGAGLGLALARDAVVAMGGDIEARNAGPGLEVFVTLPLHEGGLMERTREKDASTRRHSAILFTHKAFPDSCGETNQRR